MRPFLDAGQNELLAAELRFQTGFGKATMPKGAIHGDLFCDNVLFVDDRVSGIIDFGFAATDFLAYDLAITVNDWCIVDGGDEAGALVPELVDALVGAYHAVRPLTARRARAMAGAAARGGAALLAVAAVRPSPAASRRARPCARPRVSSSASLRDRVARPLRLPELDHAPARERAPL